jgi:uncharacterized RDD family membrane protein YckC
VGPRIRQGDVVGDAAEELLRRLSEGAAGVAGEVAAFKNGAGVIGEIDVSIGALRRHGRPVYHKNPLNCSPLGSCSRPCYSPQVDGRNRANTVPASLQFRGLAFLIDWGIVFVLAVFVAGGAGVSEGARLPVLLSLASVYEVGFMVAMGTTPGKIAMRMQVTDAHGKRLEPDKAVLRSVVFLIGIFALFIGFAISLLLASSDPMHRTLHDRLAGSIVVRL